MKKQLTLLISILIVAGAVAQSSKVPVFISGQEGHKSYRIPAIVSLPNKNLIAFAEGRVHDAGDFGDVKIVMKTSADGGKTWSALKTIVSNDTLQAGNPAPVVDLTDPAYPKGRIFLFYNTGNNHEGEVRKGNGHREVWYVTSADGGNSWSTPVNITGQVHRINQPNLNPEWNFKEDWRSYANTPGHALQIENGKYQGRIYIAANHSAGGPKPKGADYQAHGFYTDDHGKTFKLSEVVSFPGSNESTAAELSDNRVMMNSRNQFGDPKLRIVSISKDGGANWDTTYFDHNLPDPVCQGSILNIGKKKGKSILAFCNDASTTRRDSLMLRISYDEGKTWSKNILIDAAKSNTQADPVAYSDILAIGKNKIGVLYEKDNYSQIVFTILKWK